MKIKADYDSESDSDYDNDSSTPKNYHKINDHILHTQS